MEYIEQAMEHFSTMMLRNDGQSTLQLTHKQQKQRTLVFL